jgi:hypothetical protein
MFTQTLSTLPARMFVPFNFELGQKKSKIFEVFFSVCFSQENPNPRISLRKKNASPGTLKHLPKNGQ